jgi:hypothetical protein
MQMRFGFVAFTDDQSPRGKMIDRLQNVQFGDIAGWVAALAAIGGLWFAGVQIRSARDIQREATAHDIWMNYEQSGLEYPKYANPELSVLDYNKKTLDGERQLFYEYAWFCLFHVVGLRRGSSTRS